MKVQVLEVSSYEREVEIELPPEDVRKGFDKALKDVRKKARIPGFRKGKVPRSVLLQRFRPHVEGGVVESLIEGSLGSALARQGLVPVSQPIVDRGPLAEGKPFRYTLRFEVMPKVELKDYTGLDVEGITGEVTDEQVEAALERKRQSSADLQSLDDEPAAEGHVVTYSYDGTIDGEPLTDGRREDLKALLGAGKAPPVFEAALGGRRPGETFTVDEVLPDEYPEQALVGKRLIAEVTVDDVAERLVPDLDDEFARDNDYDDLDALRVDLREELAGKADKEARKENARRVVKAVLENNDFEVPPALVRGRTDANLQGAKDSFAEKGVDLEQLQDPAELRAFVQQHVVFETRSQVVVDALVRQERLDVTDADVDAKMEEIAAETDTPLPKVRATYAQGEGRAELEHALRTERALDFLMAENTIVVDSDPSPAPSPDAPEAP